MVAIVLVRHDGLSEAARTALAGGMLWELA
jgi:hypothetical protein